jgi:CheY-like chemotaxis protein
MTDEPTLGRWQVSIGNEAPQSPQIAAPHSTASGPTEPVAPRAIPDAVGLRSKSVLLVDSNRQSRESRADILRTRGVQVDCVADADAARVRLATEKYDLILVDPGRERESAESLAQEIRATNSRQLVGFLVGSPLFVVKSLNGASSPRPPRPPATPPVAAGQTPNASAAGGIDFGQRIRAAEAVRDAEAHNKT